MGLNIDFKLLPMKAHYLLYNAGTGAVVPFMPVFARQLGFSTFVVGSIYSILPILGLVAKPLFGALADKYHRHKAMFLFFILITIVSFASIIAISPVQKITEVDFKCNDAVSDLKFCSDTMDYCGIDKLQTASDRSNETVHFDLKCKVTTEWTWDYICNNWLNNSRCLREEDNLISVKTTVLKRHIDRFQECLLFENRLAQYTNKIIQINHEPPVNISCPSNLFNETLKCVGNVDSADVMNVIAEPRIHDDRITSYSEFWYFFIAMAISWIGMAVVVSVGDAICFDLLGKRHELYGNQRLWGAVGWGTFSIIAGLLVDENSTVQSYKNYTVIFILMAIALLPDMLISSCLEFKPNKVSSSILKDVGKLFKSLRVIVFFVWCIAIGFCMALIWNFLFWHLEDLADQKGDCNHQERMKTLQGIALGIQSFAGDLPFFFISGWLINRIGIINSMSLVLLAFGVRLTLYSFLSNPWWIMPIELLQGVSFALFYSTMTTYATIIAPSGTSATLQGLVGAVFEGVGVSAGSFIGGWLMNNYGGSITFRIFGISAILLAFVHYAVQWILSKRVDEIVYLSTDEFSTVNDEMQIFYDDDD